MQTDEAAPDLDGLIVNMQLGLQFIMEQFGVRPKVAWQLDTFGYSAQHARLMAEVIEVS